VVDQAGGRPRGRRAEVRIRAIIEQLNQLPTWRDTPATTAVNLTELARLRR
jgi:hypothetical protein